MDGAIVDAGAMRLSGAAGLQAEINANGSLRRFDCGAVSLTLFVGSEIEGGPANLYLRRRSDTLQWTPLLGPRSGTRFHIDPASGMLVGSGAWLGLEYVVALALARNAPAWFWHVSLRNSTSTAQLVDLTYAQDLALAPYGAVRMNEYFVSQYLDHTPLHHAAYGHMIASRQNQAVDARHPWCLIGSLREGVSFATDALQFQGLAGREGAAPPGLGDDLPGRRLQHEHSMVVIRDVPLRLDPGKSAAGCFFGSYLADHPEASSIADLARVEEVSKLSEAAPVSIEARPAASGGAATLFSSAPFLGTLELDAAALRTRFALPWRHEERDERGELLSFFYGANRHVVLRDKELRVKRPHGQILRTGLHSTPAEAALTSTAWMSGVFHSMVTQGHVSINRFLSTVRSYLGLFHAHGQRVFVELGGTWRLLGVPSAFEMAPDDACHWIYRHEQGVIELRTEACSTPHALTLSIEVISGEPARFLITHHVALDGDDGSMPVAPRWRRDGEDIVVAPTAESELARRFPHGAFRIAPLAGTALERIGGDEVLFLDGCSRGQPYLCIVTASSMQAGLSIRGELIGEETQSPLYLEPGAALFPLTLRPPATSAAGEPASRLAEIVPWFTHDAWVHYLSPRGLEQYSGGGWGTRDVCQGPVEMLLALGQLKPVRSVLLRVMGAQNPDGDWPQWFTFFERERAIRAGDSHGDIVFWPLVALAQYLLASGDAGVLDERASFFAVQGAQRSEEATIWEHVQRALSLIERRVIAGTALAAYGHGDWNDSLQPADPHMRDHLCSAWTVTLHVQALRMLARALRAVGRAQAALPLEKAADAVQRDFERLLLVDGVLAGYALFDGGRVRYLLHPGDRATGVRYSALAMIHAILEDMLTPSQAHEHVRLIEKYLSGPDGARLFDRPMAYHGGPQRLFQRAESATFFGREIGLMYMHAHLRYAQALAHLGEAERFFHALCQANPIGVRAFVPSATLRQANCYFSSSDAAFEDRYQASAQYERITQGTIALDGGWRVYSSGAGIALGLIVRRFLGLSYESPGLSVDPVMPSTLDGMHVQTKLFGREFEIRYRVGEAGCGVNEIQLNGVPLPFTRGPNPYRRGAAIVARAAVDQELTDGRNVMLIDIG